MSSNNTEPRRFECQNCGETYSEGGFVPFEEIRDLPERVSPGERVPDGECPDCGALVHEAGQPRVVVEVDGGVAEVTECPGWVSTRIIDHDDERAEREAGGLQ